jgi:hypothetical protein
VRFRIKRKCGTGQKALPGGGYPCGKESNEDGEDMSEIGIIVIGICVLAAVYALSRKVNAWRIKNTYLEIIQDLQTREALTPSSAVRLPYAKAGLFRIGLRDFRPKALEYLVLGGIVGMTEEGAYYLEEGKAEVLQSK